MKEGLFEKKTLQKFRANSEAVFIFQVIEILVFDRCKQSLKRLLLPSIHLPIQPGT
jgi:hypothetical protein